MVGGFAASINMQKDINKGSDTQRETIKTPFRYKANMISNKQIWEVV